MRAVFPRRVVRVSISPRISRRYADRIPCQRPYGGLAGARGSYTFLSPRPALTPWTGSDWYDFQMALFRRKSPADHAIEDFAKMFEPSTATSAHTPESEKAMQRFLEAQDARAAQAEAADEGARSFIEMLGGASSDVRYCAALGIAEGYEEARALTLREMELMIAEMTARIPDYTERQKDITRSYEGYEMAGLPQRFVRAAVEWRAIAEFERLRPE
jgi:hypothetical protein